MHNRGGNKSTMILLTFSFIRTLKMFYARGRGGRGNSLEKGDALGKARWKQEQKLQRLKRLLHSKCSSKYQDGEDKCRLREMAPGLRCFTRPHLKPDTVAPVYNPSTPLPGNGKQSQENPQKGRRRPHIYYLSNQFVLWKKRKAVGRSGLILASRLHQ